MAVQLHKAITKSLGLRLPVSILFEHPTLKALAYHLAELSATTEKRAVATTVAPTAPSPKPQAGPPTGVEEMSEQELLAFLDETSADADVNLP